MSNCQYCKYSYLSGDEYICSIYDSTATGIDCKSYKLHHALEIKYLQEENKQLEAKVRKLEITVTEIVLGADEAKAVAMELRSKNKQLREALKCANPYIDYACNFCKCQDFRGHEDDCIYVQLTKEAT